MPGGTLIDPPTASQIRRAKNKAVGGGRKRCVKGKSCSASCIDPNEFCLVDLPDTTTSGINKVRQKVQAKGKALKMVVSKGLEGVFNQGVNRFRDLVLRMNQKIDPAGIVIPTRFRKVPEEVNPTGRSKPSAPMTINEKLEPKRKERAKLREAKSMASKVLDSIKASKDGDLTKVSGSLDPDKVKWKAIEGSGSRVGGRGVFGAFFTVPTKKLLGFSDDMPPEVGVKAGRLGQNEAVIMKRLGEAGIGPKLIAATRLNKAVSNMENGTIHNGIIAMEVVKGTPVYRAKESINGQNTRDIYWSARGKLHKLGIAHNDAHGGNFIIDDRGNGRFVDLGLAQRSWKAALSEALGGYTGADFQTAIPARRAQEKIFERNYARVKDILKEEGFSDSDIKQIAIFGIQRSPDEYRNSPYQRISIPLAKRLINTFYDGI
jgi:hypothetical protein